MKTNELKTFRDKLKEDLIKNYGEHCKKRAFGCFLCDAWVMFDSFDAYVNDRVATDEWMKKAPALRKLLKTTSTKNVGKTKKK